MTVGSNTLYFSYDASGTPVSVTYNGTTYYYATNLQGDVTAILNSSGTAVVSYTYDAWGRPLTTTGDLASTLGTHNPLRYRGYVYDTETGLYYLQSRYYNPEISRFSGPDIVYDTDAGLQGYDLFVYCGNNPVNRIDISGADSTDIDNADITDDQVDNRENGKSKGSSRSISAGTGTTTSKKSSNHGSSWAALRAKYWKSQATKNSQATGKLSNSNTYIVSQDNIDLMQSGKAPYGTDGKKVQLHHPNGIAKDPYSFYEIRATDHWSNYKGLHPYLYNK